MIWRPKLVNAEEVLDDPSVALDTRKALLLELDRTNIRYGTYAKYCARFFAWLEHLHHDHRPIKVLEIGSGSGGLAREIVKSPRNKWDIEYSLMDQDPEILTWAQRRLQQHDIACRVFPSTDQHLRQFPDKSFDVIVSLHVIHHIHPIGNVQKMFQDAFRVARRGFFHADFERRLGNVAMTHVVNTLAGLSTDLNEDGVKSVKRAYTAGEITQCLDPIPGDYDARVQAIFPYPHMIITGSTRSSVASS